MPNFGVSRMFPSLLIGQHLSDASRDFATLTLEDMTLALIRVFVFRLCTKFEVRRPYRSEDIGYILCEH